MLEANLPLKTIETLVISPSVELSELAVDCGKHLPSTSRFFLSRLGINCDEGSNMLSYLLFDGHYCRRLIDLGYKDTINKKEQLKSFLDSYN